MSASTFRASRPTPGTPRTVGAAAPTDTGVFHYPSLTTTVPKEFVHRASVAQVMLTDWDRVDDSHFTAAAQWPRGHSFFTEVDGCHDPLIAGETIRQAGALLAHAEFGVPLGHHFLMWDLAIRVQPAHLRVDSAPASLEMDIACHDIKWRRAGLAGFRYDVVIRRDGNTAATGSARFTCVSPQIYERLRGGRHNSARPALPLTAPTAPQNVGRVSPMDVVLTPIGETRSWQLRVDTRHPVLFDHPVDHVPGMMLLEAARQAATAALGRPAVLLGATGEFKRYTELDLPCLIEACPLPGTGTDAVQSVLVNGHQDGRLTFCSTLTVAASPTA
ncbi:ScbA/BarX family gamma-butyrolactone biosynthesis protein [Streptomyces sp. STR69]|uniref:ScbA/BarX family gamma-butyrolactone biosynthesis protein n=1 Tax=Streptomyces sp. STR69 TaxID=1796942 RepID=UPI0021C736B0|nr:ScbA/BarX family gamma-butyrolactone biosynthesis protein [Streptomyces sp. STR69]